MGRLTRLALLSAAVLSAATAAAAASHLTVDINQSRRIGLAGSAANVVVGDPTIADVTMIDAHSVIVTGKGYGVTQIMVMNRAGRTLLDGVHLCQAWLQLRGLPGALVQPVIVDELDVSTPTARSLVVLRMVSFFLLVSMLTGGLTVAIDATAGERERGSLEPLLTTPVRRRDLALGKLAATMTFMALSLALTCAAFCATLPWIPLATLGMTSHFTPSVAARIALVMLPMIVPGAALLTSVASFTRSYREAQSWLAAILMLPGLPVLLAGVLELPLATQWVWIPSMGQHLLIQALLRGDAIGAGDVVLLIGSTLLLGAAGVALVLRLYERDRLLG